MSANDDPRALLHHSRSSTKRIPFHKQGPWKEDVSSKPVGHIGTSAGAVPRNQIQEEDVIVDQIPISNGVYNPAKIVNQQLLDVTPGALVAVTHIDDCIGILEENEISFPEEEFIHRLQQKFLPMQSNGTEYDCLIDSKVYNAIQMEWEYIYNLGCSIPLMIQR